VDYLLGIQVMITGLLYGPLNDDATIDDTAAFARQWQPDLIICEPMSFSGAMAARVTGAAHARILSEPPRAPRVCLTLGVSAREDRQTDDVSIGTVLGALGDLDIEIVATLDSSQQRILRSAPANTRLVDFVPMHALLPTCAAVVHHGGAGTFLAANLYGVPQVTIPSLWETPMKGLMLEQANP